MYLEVKLIRRLKCPIFNKFDLNGVTLKVRENEAFRIIEKELRYKK